MYRGVQYLQPAFHNQGAYQEHHHVLRPSRSNRASLQQAKAPLNTKSVASTSRPRTTQSPQYSRNGCARPRTTNTCLRSSWRHGTSTWTKSFSERQRSPPNAPPNARVFYSAGPNRHEISARSIPARTTKAMRGAIQSPIASAWDRNRG